MCIPSPRSQPSKPPAARLLRGRDGGLGNGSMKASTRAERIGAPQIAPGKAAKGDKATAVGAASKLTFGGGEE